MGNRSGYKNGYNKPFVRYKEKYKEGLDMKSYESLIKALKNGVVVALGNVSNAC